MNKKTLIITVSSIALLGAGIGAFIYFRNKGKDKRDKEDRGETEKETTASGGATATTEESEWSAKDLQAGDTKLRIGSEGRKVAMLQALLNHFEGQNLKIDGSFGNATRWALVKSGFPSCMNASQCEVTPIEFKEMLVKGAKSKTFLNKYNPKTNSDMVKVYAKYKS